VTWQVVLEFQQHLAEAAVEDGLQSTQAAVIANSAAAAAAAAAATDPERDVKGRSLEFKVIHVTLNII